MRPITAVPVAGLVDIREDVKRKINIVGVDKGLTSQPASQSRPPSS